MTHHDILQKIKRYHNYSKRWRWLTRFDAAHMTSSVVLCSTVQFVFAAVRVLVTVALTQWRQLDDHYSTVVALGQGLGEEWMWEVRREKKENSFLCSEAVLLVSRTSTDIIYWVHPGTRAYDLKSIKILRRCYDQALFIPFKYCFKIATCCQSSSSFVLTWSLLVIRRFETSLSYFLRLLFYLLSIFLSLLSSWSVFVLSMMMLIYYVIETLESSMKFSHNCLSFHRYSRFLVIIQYHWHLRISISDSIVVKIHTIRFFLWERRSSCLHSCST